MKIISSEKNSLFTYAPSISGCILMGFLLIIRPEVAAEGVRTGLDICALSVIPSLFPFMALSAFIIRSEICSLLGKRLGKFSGFLFSLPGEALPAVLMGFIGGFPIGASMTEKLLEKEAITKNQAQRMMLFCVNCGPAFAVGTIGSALFSSPQAGMIIYFSLISASLITGFLSKFLSDGKAPEKKPSGKLKTPHISESFTLAVADSSAAVFSVCAWVILFSAVGSFTDLIPLSGNFKIFIKSVLEVTTGVSAAAGEVPLPIICLIAGFGGISVHCQILKSVIKTGMKFSFFITSRIINGALAAAVCEVILKIFPVTVSVLSNSAEAVPIACSSSVPAAAGLLITGGLLILELDSKRRMC